MKFESKKFRLNQDYQIPSLSNKQSLNEGLANYLGMAVFHENEKGAKDYKNYKLFLDLMIDTTGKAQIISIKNLKKLPEDKIKLFVESALFETNSIPKGVDKWLFSGVLCFMNKNREEAKKERVQDLIDEKLEYENRLVADTIDGHYIPKNLEECFIELDKILKPITKKVIKNENGEYNWYDSHFGIGLWIRNNWSLWGGSRLEQYFRSKGELFADDMSGVIIRFYIDWLNGQHEKWKEYDNQKLK
jgi:hypothetical protein